MISIICPTNDKKVLNEMLIPSINKQKYKNYELIIIDAKEKGFKSAAETLNYGASLAKGDLLVFCHQDIELINDDFFENLIEYSNKYNFGIAGVAGKSNDNKVYSSVIQGVNRVQAGIKNEEVFEVETLDECLFIIKKENFTKFDENNKTWHLYAVDYSLNCLMLKKKVLLFPLKLYHLSPGYSLNASFYDELLQLGKKYKKLKIINTTMITIKNNTFFKLKVRYKKYKLILKKCLKGGK